MKIGGRGSSCLRFSLTRSFSKSYGKYSTLYSNGKEKFIDVILSDQIKMNSSYCNPKVESYHGAPE